MTYPAYGQQQFGYPQQPPVTSPVAPKPAPSRGTKPRGWHIAAAVSAALMVAFLILANLPEKCDLSKFGEGGNYGSTTVLKGSEALQTCLNDKMAVDGTTRSTAEILCAGVKSSGTYIHHNEATASAKPECEPRGKDAANVVGWGSFIAAFAAIVMGLRRRKQFAEHRRNVTAVEDFIRRVPPGFEDRVPPQVLADVAQRGQSAAHVVFMDREYLGALTGTAAIAKADLYNAAANRAALAYNSLLPAMAAQMPDEEEPLEAPDLGGATPTTTPADDADDWLSGVDGNDGDDW